MKRKRRWPAWFRRRPKNQAAPPDEIVISADDMQKITLAWLYTINPKRKQRLCWLMLLYSNPNIKDLAKKLNITPVQLLDALNELKGLKWS